MIQILYSQGLDGYVCLMGMSLYGPIIQMDYRCRSGHPLFNIFKKEMGKGETWTDWISIKYSLSPWIHEQFLQASGIEGEYELFEIKPDTSLKKVIKDMKKSGVKGVNVTVPYKQQIIPYLDGLDPVASSIGAVNTIMVANGKMIGYNTDGVGYIKGLNDMYPDFLSRQTKCLIIGAGGAARSIYVTLSKYGIKHMD